MVEPIRSAEKFGRASMMQGPAPKHVHDDHIGCAYYVVTAEIAPDIAAREFVEVECTHGFSAGGAFYNEDYVRELKIAAQSLIAEIDYDGPPLHQKTSTTEAIEKLRELTK